MRWTLFYDISAPPRLSIREGIHLQVVIAMPPQLIEPCVANGFGIRYNANSHKEAWRHHISNERCLSIFHSYIAVIVDFCIQAH